ncbi:monovalent cation/H(+) antiporter subunit G [Haloarchaeobius sp. HRN-SO-5]|uniref:monovalent cation/H(+) antiporter subunit G n=1 Tax=Haloarchaeobius sp. HRN-SO-5 TaxID=3446118 RepID=UPI003EBE10DE
MTLVETLQYAVIAVSVLVGSFFLLVGTIGLIRLPTVYNRMHATSKATTLGAASMFVAGVVYFEGQGVALEALVGIVFLFLTAPTGAHLISRAAQKMGVDFLEDVEWPTPGAGIDRDAVETGDDTSADD